MRKSYIGVLVVCAGAFGIIAQKRDRPVYQPPLPMSEVVAEPSLEIIAVDERLAKKERLIDRLIAGDFRLVDAAEAVIALNREWPPIPPESYDVYPGQSLRERVAHVLVRTVEGRLAEDDLRRERILRRLAGELGDIAAAGAPSADD